MNEIALDVLEPLTEPIVIHYTGHMIGRLVPQYEHLIAQRIAKHLDAKRVGTAFGALAWTDAYSLRHCCRRDVSCTWGSGKYHEDAFMAMLVAEPDASG